MFTFSSNSVFPNFIPIATFTAEVSYLNPVFLLNPVVTLFALLDEQIGLPEVISGYIRFQDNTDFIMNNWFSISLVVQTAVTIINISLANYILNPFKNGARR